MSNKEELSEQYRLKVYEDSSTRKRCKHNNELINWNNEIVNAFEAGYDARTQEIEHFVWQISEANFEKGKEIDKKEIIDKACEWLIEHKEAVETEDNGIMGWIPDYFIEDFRRVMEE